MQLPGVMLAPLLIGAKYGGIGLRFKLLVGWRFQRSQYKLTRSNLAATHAQPSHHQKLRHRRYSRDRIFGWHVSNHRGNRRR